MKNAGRALLYVVMMTAGGLLLASCETRPTDTMPELYWPFPPEKPRIKFVDLILGSLDATGTRQDKFKNVVFGGEEEVAFDKPSFASAKKKLLLVSDLNRVHVFDFKNKKYFQVGLGFLTSATGVGINDNGTIYVGDSVRKRVLAFVPGEQDAQIFVGRREFERPAGIAIDEVNKRVLVVDTLKHTVGVYTYTGEKLFTVGGRGKEAGKLNFPYDVAVDGKGRIFVMDAGNFRVQIFNADGTFLMAFGSVGADAGMFARPKGIALDSEGHIYVVDSAFGNFQIFDETGNILLSVGTNGVDPGMFMLPFGIAIDENDKIYAVDQMNRRVQVFQYLKDEAEGASGTGK